MVKTSPSKAGGVGSIAGQRAKIPHALRPKRKTTKTKTKHQNIKQKQYCNKFNKDFKNGPHQKNLFKKRTKTKVSRRKKLIKIRAEINKTETR